MFKKKTGRSHSTAAVSAILKGDIGAAKRHIGRLVSSSNPDHLGLQLVVLSACVGPDSNVLKYLLTKGISVNFKTNINNKEPSFNSICGGLYNVLKWQYASEGDGSECDVVTVAPLHVAVYHGAYDVMETLLSAGGLNTTDIRGVQVDGGNTALHVACARCDCVAVRMLLCAGAQVSVLNAHGLTPLQMASRFGHVELVRMLLLAGAEVFSRGQRGESPLHVAAAEGHVALVHLFSNIIDINIRTPSQRPALHVACAHAQVEAVCFLLDKLGADITMLDSEQRTPLHALLATPHRAHRSVRSRQDYVTTCDILLSRGVNVNRLDIEGATALHMAVKHRAPTAVIRAILLHGSDPSILDCAGMKAREYVDESDVEVVQMFERYTSLSYLHLPPPAYEETESSCVNCHAPLVSPDHQSSQVYQQGNKRLNAPYNTQETLEDTARNAQMMDANTHRNIQKIVDNTPQNTQGIIENSTGATQKILENTPRNTRDIFDDTTQKHTNTPISEPNEHHYLKVKSHICDRNENNIQETIQGEIFDVQAIGIKEDKIQERGHINTKTQEENCSAKTHNEDNGSEENSEQRKETQLHDELIGHVDSGNAHTQNTLYPNLGRKLNSTIKRPQSTSCDNSQNTIPNYNNEITHTKDTGSPKTEEVQNAPSKRLLSTSCESSNNTIPQCSPPAVPLTPHPALLDSMNSVKLRQKVILNDGRVIYHTMPSRTREVSKVIYPI